MGRRISGEGGKRFAVCDMFVNVIDQFLSIDVGVVPGLTLGIGGRKRNKMAIFRVSFGIGEIVAKMILRGAAQ
jgi:hypothetical protein